MSAPLLRIDDLHVAPAGAPDISLLRGLDLRVAPGEVHAIVGPTGAGKSTIARALLGATTEVVLDGSITLDGDDITAWPTDDRARAGLFVGFQQPVDLPNVRLGDVLHRSHIASGHGESSVRRFRAEAEVWLDRLGLPPSFIDRGLNDGFSGGESRRTELLQMALLRPKLAYLDDIGSGLDVVGIDTVARGLRLARDANPALGIVVVATTSRIIDAVGVDHVHILIDGRIVERGGPELAQHLELNGHDTYATRA